MHIGLQVVLKISVSLLELCGVCGTEDSRRYMNTRESCEEKLERSGLQHLYLDRVNAVLEDSCTLRAEEAYINSIRDHFDTNGLAIRG